MTFFGNDKLAQALGSQGPLSTYNNFNQGLTDARGFRTSVVGPPTNSINTNINRRQMENMIARATTPDAVAIHPERSGQGLFLQQTDGLATEIEGGAELYVYARSKNVLRIKSGMAGLAYAN
jgi:hypothetical protein